MRRLTTRYTVLAAAAAAVLLLASSGCRQNSKESVQTIDEKPDTLLSTVHMADSKAAPQLLNGFYPVEGNAWRWTAGKFAVALHPVAGATQNGAKLVVRFVIPDSALARNKAMTLSGKVGGLALAPETYTKAGDHTYTREVPATVLASDRVVADFALDKFLPAGAVEQRELGIVVNSIGFDPK
jgi:hypothetical protein